MKSSSLKLGVILICIWLLISYGYTNAEDSADWSPVQIGGKCGFKDSKGKTVIRPQFDECNYFYEGLAAVKIRGKWGFINETGKVVISPRFSESSTFLDGLAIVKVGEKSGYIDMTGNYVIEPKFDEASIFSDGLAPVMVGDQWGYIDRSGNYVIEPKFIDAFLFSEGFAAVNLGSGWGYIDKQGKPVFGSQFFDRASSFSYNGLASVKVGNRWGFINKKGDMVIDPKFDSPLGSDRGPTFYGGKARVIIDDRIENIDVGGEIISGDWVSCCAGKDGLTFVYYNQNKTNYLSKNIVRVWSKWINPGVENTMDLDEIDCLNKTYKTLNITSYDKERRVVSSYSNTPEKSELHYIVPNTLMENLSDIVCPQKSK